MEPMMTLNHPMVEIFWNYWPISLVTWPYGWILNIIILPIWILQLPFEIVWNFIPYVITFLTAIPVVVLLAMAYVAFFIILFVLLIALATLQAPVVLFVTDFILIPLLVAAGITVLILYLLYDLGPIDCTGMPSSVNATICNNIVIL